MTYERTSLGALLALLLGCGGDIQVSDSDTLSCGAPGSHCTQSELQLATPNRVLRVDAEVRALAPRWTISTLAFSNLAAAPDGGAWLFSGASLPQAKRIDAEGNTLRVVDLPVPATGRAPSPGAIYVHALYQAIAHPLGPSVVARWWWQCGPGATQCSVSNEIRETQAWVIPEDASAAPFDLLAAVKHTDKDVRTATRSADGQQVLVQGSQVARLYAVAGTQLWEQSLFDAADSWGGEPLPLGADAWMMWANGSDGENALVTVRDGSTDRRKIFDAPRSANEGTRTLILPGSVAGEYTLALERSIAYPALGGPNDTDPSPSVPGDLSVVRVRDGAVVDEHLLRRADLPLELDLAAIDSAGNVYLATANAEQDPVTADLTVTPLLCRFAPRAEASCFVLPERADSLQARAPNSVLVGFYKTATLSRYDLPTP